MKFPFVIISRSKYENMKLEIKELGERVDKLNDNDHRGPDGRFVSEKQGTFE